MFRKSRIVLLAMICFCSVAVGSAADGKTNIVFILADDLGWRDLSGEGSEYYESPRIDSIASEGMRFTRGYATCQVCSPSRASIVTGKYPPRHGITTWIGDASGETWRDRKRYNFLLPADYERELRAEEASLSEVLRKEGYRTFFAGKWHMGGTGSEPQDHGFDINKGGWEKGSPQGGYFSPWTNPHLEPGPPGESLPLRLGRETAAFIDESKDRPFLAYLSFYSVHGPIQTTPKLWKKYRDKAVASGLPVERFIWDRRLPVRQVQDCPIYAGMVESMDDAVGIVLDKLKDLGLEENTIICFTSDNGGVSSGDAFATSNLPLRGGKGRQWEGGVRVPFYVKAPGLTKAGSVSAVPVSGIDWYPTILELVGAAIPKEQEIDGVSLVPLLKGGSLPDRPLYWHYPHYGNQGGEPSSIITENNWKLIHYYEDGRDELYNLSSDPAETRDLARDEPGRIAALRTKLNAWLRSAGAVYPSLDTEYDAVKDAERLEDLKTSFKRTLENRHASYVEEDYQPDPTWWGSLPEGGTTSNK